jgi:hypothetical protein
VKIADRVSFPMVVNLINYLHGYDAIKNKKYDDHVKTMQQYAKSSVEKNLDAENKK